MSEVIFLGERTSREFFAGASCAFGVFDGVHKGHRSLIDNACSYACRSDGKSVVLTFAVDPDELFAPDKLVKLLSNEERISLLAQSGADAVAVLPFDRSFAALGPTEFLDWTFRGFAPASMHVGEGFRFGARALGTPDDLRRWGERGGMRVCEHELVSCAGQPISATRIRRLAVAGEVSFAEELLGHVLAARWRPAAALGC